MKLKIIGNNGVFPGTGGACSSYLFKTENHRILVDMGPGSLARLQEVCALEEIDIFVFSHLHFDHISDFFSAKYALQLKKARGQYQKRPMLILPQNPGNICELVQDDALFDVHFIRDGLDLKLKNTRLTFKQMTHPVESYAVKITERGKSIVYSGDTDRPDVISEFAAGAQLLLSDAGLLKKHKSPSAPHMSIAEACAAGEQVSETVLVHLNPLYSAEELLKEVTGNAKLSELGWEYELS